MTVTAPEDEVVDLVSSLIRFDTSNTGEPETTKGEEDCARWVAEKLREVGYTTEYVEAGRPAAETSSAGSRVPKRVAAPSSSTATSTSSPPSPPTGASTRSPAR